jgi:PPOX class probable F420-dependent enzyme
MAAETELWDLIASRREGVLATIKPGGLPQLTNVLYLPEPGGRTVRISTTADRLKARVLARDPRAVLHVTGDSFWAYAVAEGHATLTPAAAEPGDQACRELLEVHTAFYGPQAKDAFFAEMVARRRLVIRLDLGHVHGVIATGGRRPLPVSLTDLSHAERLTMPVIAVVGAGPGLGLAIARRFGREGFRVALISRAQSKLDALAAELAASTPQPRAARHRTSHGRT